MEQPWRVGFFVALAAGSMVGVACGGGGDGTDASSTPPQATTSTVRDPSPADEAAVEAAAESLGGGTEDDPADEPADRAPAEDAEEPAEEPADEGGGDGGGDTLDVGGDGSGAGCAGDGPEPPSGGATVADVDGDGATDRAWVDGAQVGVATAAGGGGTWDSSLGQGVTLLVADADGRLPVELFVSDGSTAELLVFEGCGVRPVIGPDGAPFLFDLGTRGNGTGVGCVDVGGRRRLVGLDVTADDGTTVAWERTVIELDGASATIGGSDTGTFRRPDQAGAIALLHTISCHELLIEEDGVG